MTVQSKKRFTRREMLTSTIKNLIAGNILLVICCAFYLAWWLIAFKPAGAVKGMSSGWLLLPAAVAGIGAIFVLILSFRHAAINRSLISGTLLLVLGVIAYVALLAITGFFLHRMVTTELLLIVGWCILALSEVNVLYGLELFSFSGAVLWFVMVIISAAVSMICYILYYGLDEVKGYIDGMVPLLIIGVVMCILTVAIVVRK